MYAEASSPAIMAAKNAAAAGGKDARSTSSRRSVLDIAPIIAADIASGTGLLNMIEKPNTPQKLVSRRNTIYCSMLRFSGRKSTGLRCSASAISHAAIVAINTIITA